MLVLQTRGQVPVVDADVVVPIIENSITVLKGMSGRCCETLSHYYAIA
jgi:hypothetical protein